jgi:hypothetical protein
MYGPSSEISSIHNLVILARNIFFLGMNSAVEFGVFMRDVKVIHTTWISLRNISCSYFLPEPRRRELSTEAMVDFFQSYRKGL